MKIVLIIAIAFVFSASCMRLDDNLYNPSNKIQEYRLDNYSGTQDFILDPSYDIAPERIHLITLSSRKESEKNPVTIYAIYIGDLARIQSDTVILYCHGNKWHMDFYWQRAKLLAHVGGKNHYGVMMFDYRGFGRSEGSPSEDGMYADAASAEQWLYDNGLRGGRLVIYGFSLGSAAACELTANPAAIVPSALILEAPFASAATMVQDAAQIDLPASFVTNLRIDNAEKIKSVDQPFLWMHGDKDLFLNYRTHGQVVYDNYRGSFKEKHIIGGADHGEIPQKFGFSLYTNTLHNFIRSSH